MAGGGLDRRRLLVHRVDIVREPGDHSRPVADEYHVRHSPD